MDEASDVWQLKTSKLNINNNIQGSSSTDHLSVSSFDTDDETNMIAAANCTRLHRQQHSRPSRVTECTRNGGLNEISRSKPFPAHQVVLDSLISAKSMNGSAINHQNELASPDKTRQFVTCSKETKHQLVPRSTSNCFKKTMADDKQRLIQPSLKTNCQPDVVKGFKRTTEPVNSKQPPTQVTLRRSQSKPTKLLMSLDGDDNNLISTDRSEQKSGNITHDSLTSYRSSYDVKTKQKSFNNPNSAIIGYVRNKFDDHDEYIMSPKSPPPLTDDQTINTIETNTILKSPRYSTPIKSLQKSLTTSNNNSLQQLASGDKTLRMLESPSTIVAPPPPLSIDSSRWKSTSPSFEANNISCDGVVKVRHRFSDKAESFQASTKDKMAEESQNDELQRLRMDLQWAKDQVTLLTSHLCTNTKVVEAFDTSLSKMLQKLQALSNSKTHHNPDLNRLMDTIEALRQQNINHCIRQRFFGYSADMNSNGNKNDKNYTGDRSDINYTGDRSDKNSKSGMNFIEDKYHTSNVDFTGRRSECRGFISSSYYSDISCCDDDDDSLCDASSDVSGRQARRRYRNETDNDVSPEREKLGYFKLKLKSKKSKETEASPDTQGDKKSVKHWLKNSIGRALSRIRTPSLTSPMTSSSKKDIHVSSLPSIPLQATPRPMSMDHYPAQYASNLGHPNLTFKRFESKCHDFPSPTGLLSGSDGVTVKKEGRSRSNQRLTNNYFQPIRTDFELPNRPATSLANSYHRRSDSSDHTLRPAGFELRANKRADGQHVTVSVAVDQVDDNTKQYVFMQGNQIQIPIGTLKVGDSMTWIVLDRLIKKTFEDHLIKLDPSSRLGMDGESILNYQVGEVIRSNDDVSFLLHSPELLPIGYLVGDVTNICITLKGHREGCVDALAFELLIPKPSLSSYVHLLITHKKIILIGSSGTGKSYLAKRLADYMVDLMLNWGESSKGQFESAFGDNGNLFPPLPSIHHHHHHLEKVDPSCHIAVYRVDSQSSRELRQYLNNVAHHYQDLYIKQEHIILSSPGLNDNDGEFTMDEALHRSSRRHDNLSTFQNGEQKRETETSYIDSQPLGKTRSYKNNSTPLVIVLDNLHHVVSLGDAFCGFLDLDAKSGPYVIGTMQSTSFSPTSSSSLTSSPTLEGTVAPAAFPIGPAGDLQIHHNFRWIIYSSKVNPVRGFLGRYLSRCLVAATVAKTSLFTRRSLALSVNSEALPVGGTPMTSSLLDLHLSKVIDWLPQAWHRINAYLEASSTNDITLGPRLFLSCPMEASRAHLWFVDLWNYSLVPYLMEALKNKTQHGLKITWSKLVEWLTSTMPWRSNLDKSSCPLFLNFRPEDLGLLPSQLKTGNQSAQEVTSEVNQRSKGHDDGDDDDVFNPGTSSDLSLVDIVSRFQAVAIQSSSSETGSVNTTLNFEVEG